MEINVKDIIPFIIDAKYAILTYIIGDTVLTIYALRHGGCELNPIINYIISTCGLYWGLISCKLIVLILIFLMYEDIHRRSMKRWIFMRRFISGLGILIVINNILGISQLLGYISPIRI